MQACVVVRVQSPVVVVAPVEVPGKYPPMVEAEETDNSIIFNATNQIKHQPSNGEKSTKWNVFVFV